MDISILKSIGLSNNEIRIYLALLEIGETTTGPLTKATEQSNAKVYETLAKLRTKGLVSYEIKDNKKYFSALSPEQLLKYLDHKQTQLDQNKNQVQNIIPQLNTCLNDCDDTQKVMVYHGIQSWKTLVENMFEEVGKKGQYISIGSTFIKQCMGKEWYSYCQDKKKQMQIQSRNLWDSSILKNKELLKTYYGKSKIIPNGVGSAGVWVYKDKILEFSYSNNNYFAVLIQSKEVAQSSKELCENLWKSGKRIPKLFSAK